jgi:hypothetical protein
MFALVPSIGTYRPASFGVGRVVSTCLSDRSPRHVMGGRRL